LGYDGYCIRTDKKGKVIWKKTYGAADWDFFNSLVLANDGNLVLAGNSYSGSFGDSDGFICKIDTSDGSLLWLTHIGSSGFDDFRSAVQGSNGDYYFGGNSGNEFQKQSEFWLVRVKQNGDTVFTSKFGHAGRNDVCYDMIEDRMQNIMMCGYYDSSATSAKKQVSYMVKANLSGVKTNEFIYGGAGPNDKMLAITSGHRANDYFFSRSVLFGSNQIEVQPFLTTDNFGYLGSTTYGGPEYEETYDVIRTSDRGYAMVGYSKSYSYEKDENIYFLKLDSTFLAAQVIASQDEEIKVISKTVRFNASSGKLFGFNCSEVELVYVYDLTGKLICSFANNEESPSISINSSSELLIIQYFGKISGSIRLKQEK
jgi:hypothetical protein